MEITDWAKINNMTPEEFGDEIATTMAAIGDMRIEEKGDDSDAVMWTFPGSGLQVIVKRIDKC
jgi:hypothetical protein